MPSLIGSLSRGKSSVGNFSAAHSNEAKSEIVSEKQSKKKSVMAMLTSQQTQIWNSRISWRIASAAFMTIWLIQTLVLIFGTRPQYQAELLYHLRDQAKAAITAAIDPQMRDTRKSPIDTDRAERLMKTTKIRGFTVYNYNFEYVGSYGESVSMVLQPGADMRSRLSDNQNRYEVMLDSADFQKPYYIAVSIDSESVHSQIFGLVRQNIVIMALLSLFVTTVLMIALGKWLLEPILFMRENLIRASKNPEQPNIEDSPFDPKDEIGGAILIAQKLIRQNAENISRIKSTAEDKIHKLAYYDSLTGLPNRTLFTQSLIERTRNNAAASDGDKVERYAVVSLDLDHFKDINDSMGHNIGDAILRGVGKRLRTAMPESAVVSRMSEDEFAVLVPLGVSNLQGREVAEKVLNIIRHEPFKVFNEQFQVRASIGVSTYPDDGVEPETVLKNADIALNRAKEEGRDTIKEYSEDFDRAVQARFQMLRDLRDALEHEQFQLFYQPQLDLKSGAVIGAEALLRWWVPDHSKEGGKFVSPVDFIPVAEQSGLIVPIGEWVMETAFNTARECQEKMGKNVRIAINVSGAQFLQSDICALTSKLLAEHKIPPHLIELEVTESVFMDDIEHTINILQALHGLGVELAIDDFGTGYSSLSYLSQFPIDRLKIDQSFIRNALNDKNHASIAKTIVKLGHSLDLKVIAEGVETKDHEAFLQAESCDEVQGYRYAKPMPKDQLFKFIETYSGDLKSFDKKD